MTAPAAPPDAVQAEIRERVDGVRSRIAEAAARAGRSADEITLVGVSKRQPPERIAAAVRAGVGVLGENYVQEARDKRPLVEAMLGDAPRPRWHMVGPLQRNKAKLASELFDVVETLDRSALAQALGRRRADREPLSLLVQVNISAEPQKSGIAPQALPELLAACAGIDGVRIDGLMAVPAAGLDRNATRAAFAAMRALRDATQGAPGAEHLQALSLGMSADFELAIEEGATHVRVGTALFGTRPS